MGIWGARVVAVDDDFDTLDLLTAILGPAGADIVTVSTPGGTLSKRATMAMTRGEVALREA